MSDSRFSALAKDPRYRLPSKKEARTAVDPRFKTLFTDQEFRKKASVDRYGRKIEPEAGKKDLEKLYRLDKADQPKKVQREVVGSSDESEEEEDESEEELVTKRDPARDGGFSESESEEEETSDEDADLDSEVDLAEETAGNEQTEDIPMGEVTKRIACVNLDWDNIRAADILAVSNSFAPKGGRITGVTIYPSEFGRERLQREEMEGPPREIFASTNSKKTTEEQDSDSDSESEDDEKIKQKLLKQQENNGDEFDTAKLRQYQLERLRYYYAVIECSDNATAKALYDNMDGREYLSTSNFFDMRFIPDETSFTDDEPHEECFELPQGYMPNEFKTEALTHSKVRLTWDDDDPTRKEVQKRAFSRAEMDENDLQAYIGSDESDADSISSRVSSAAEKRKTKAEAKRAKMREALGLSLEPSVSNKGKDESVGEMQITFTAGLSTKDHRGRGVFENEPQDEESTRARYIRKEKERKQKRKERAKGRANGDAVEDEGEASEGESKVADAPEEDDPFNDPFFSDPKAAAKAEKAAKRAAREEKHAARAALDAEAESRRAELELLMAGDDETKHFDMREIEKAEKAARRKGKKSKKDKKSAAEEVNDEFQVETEDPRFQALFDQHEYAIDPTNKKFKKTKGMEKLLQEGRKKRKGGGDEDDGEERSGKKVRKMAKGVEGEDDVKGLVARLKSKSKSRGR